MTNLAISLDRLLPWEDVDEYETLFTGLLEEFEPQGPTERHLVEELAGCMWRLKRVAVAESALHRKELGDVLGRNVASATAAERAVAHIHASDIIATEPETSADLKDTDDSGVAAMWALDILQKGGASAYEDALTELPDNASAWWQQELENADPDDPEAYCADAEGLRWFIEAEALPKYVRAVEHLECRPLIRSQILGETLDPSMHAALARHEGRLDRKLERTLRLLMTLQNTRRKYETS